MKVLVLHGLQRRSRKTTIDHVLAFARHLQDGTVRYHHLREPGLAAVLAEDFDVVVLSHCLLSHRTTPFWSEHLERLAPLRDRRGLLVAVPQDDYKASAALDRAMVTLGVDHIFSPLDRRLDEIYPLASAAEIPVTTVLTGYLEPGDLAESEPRPLQERSIDLGTRVRALPPQYGQIGRRKAEHAEKLAHAARRRGFAVDVSTRPEDTLLGDAWMSFLGDCRFTIGSRGGASIIDRDGDLARRVEAFLERNPSASDSDVRGACFPDARDEPMTAISPRLFEAAASGTCQILSRDTYLDLVPGEHYIELHEDFGNLDEVLNSLADLETAQQMVRRARRAVLDDADKSYPAFVRKVLEGAVSRAPESAVDDIDVSDALEAAPLRLGEELFDAFRALLLQAFRAGQTEALARLFDAADGLCRTQPELVRATHRAHLGPLLGWRAEDGLADAAIDVARYAALAGGGPTCRAWFDALARGDVDEQALWPWASAELVARTR